ncbi:MAG TPA: lantibiotic dehydratase C-terminal domain-containing protein [Kutzneria sp.]|nr:lantibiotic dehydratase C-terminal domain-containing protein [Kutzneria sp.]
MAEHRWISAHLCYQGDQDLMLTRVVAPLSGELFFLRHWEGGPHVRLRVRADSHQADHVRSVISQSAEAFFRDRPSADTMSAEEYAEIAPRLAAAEQLPTFEPVLRPNNSVHFVDYRPDTARYGSGPALAAVEQHLMSASELALDLIAQGRTAGRRAMDAFAMLAAVRTLFTDILPELAYQARFVAEGRGGVAESLDAPEFQAHYAANRQQLCDRLTTVWAIARGEGAASHGPITAWLASIRELHGTLVALDERGELDARPEVDAPAEVLGHINHVVPQLILEHCAHLMCNRLGLTQVQEFHLRALLVRTAFDLCAV